MSLYSVTPQCSEILMSPFKHRFVEIILGEAPEIIKISKLV
jgi:hypothetical protein